MLSCSCFRLSLYILLASILASVFDCHGFSVLVVIWKIPASSAPTSTQRHFFAMIALVYQRCINDLGFCDDAVAPSDRMPLSLGCTPVLSLERLCLVLDLESCSGGDCRSVLPVRLLIQFHDTNMACNQRACRRCTCRNWGWA